MQNVRCGHKQRRQRLRLIADNGRASRGGKLEEGTGIVIAFLLLMLSIVAPPPPPSRVSIKTQQFADFLFSNHDASQPSPSPSSPLFIHNVNTDKKLLNHCNTKPTLASCYTLQQFRLRASSNSSSGSNSNSSSKCDCDCDCCGAGCGNAHFP